MFVLQLEGLTIQSSHTIVMHKTTTEFKTQTKKRTLY